MKNLLPPAYSLALGLCLAGFSQAATVAFTGTGATSGGAGGTLNIGREFTVTGAGIIVNDLGVFDLGGDGLAASHAVTLFSIGSTGANPTSNALGSVNVPAGMSAILDSGFRFFALAAPLTLPAGNYAVIAYGLSDANDRYGDGGGFNDGGNFANAVFDPFQFTSNSSPAFPDSGDTNSHSSASFRFDPVPEPSGAALIGLAGAALLILRKKR